MLVVERKRKQPKRDRTLFRRTLNKLMVSRDIFFWKDLRVELERVGYDVGQSRLSQYLNGQRDPEDLEELFAAIGRALNLTRDEKMLLAFSYAYPQGNGQAAGPERTSPVPDESGPTQSQREDFERWKNEKDQSDTAKGEEGADGAGDRVP